MSRCANIVFRLERFFFRIGVLANDINGMYDPWEPTEYKEQEVDEQVRMDTFGSASCQNVYNGLVYP
jgi:hypothetical protein